MTTQTLNKPHYGTFTIDRSYAHSPERVFRAFENADAFYRWFVSGEGWEIGSYSHDFRVGGRDQSKFRPEGHPEWFGNDTWYLEIEKARRIVTAYSMSAEGKPFSHSLAVIELYSDGKGGCRLVYTEQGAYYGDENDVKNRRVGCDELFGKLEAELRDHA
jgi:uncharacterized protein YndB with AHSA1/START domain